jgi:hypothetical protein
VGHGGVKGDVLDPGHASVDGDDQECSDDGEQHLFVDLVFKEAIEWILERS